VHKIALQILNKWVHVIGIFKDSCYYKLRDSFSNSEYEDKIWSYLRSNCLC